MANFLLSDTATGASFARWVLSGQGSNCSQGAVDDLKYNSQAIANLNGSRINWNIVPSHAITTYDLNPSIINTTTLGFDENTLVVLVSLNRLETTSSFLNEVFPSEASDLVVPLSSQVGGLNSYHTELGIVHTGSPSDLLTLADLHNLLDENPNTDSDFTNNNGGFNPPSLLSNFRLSEPEHDTSVYTFLEKSNLVHITNPTSNFIFSNNITIPIIADGPINVTRFIISAGNNISGFSSIDTSTNPATFNYLVPRNFSGDLKLMAIGYDASNNYVDMDTLTLHSTISLTDSLFFPAYDLFVPFNQSMQITLFGLLHDSSIINLTYSDSVQYSVSNTSIFTFDSTASSLFGVDTGIAVLHAHFRTLDAYLLVHVYNAENQVLTHVKPSPKQDNKKYINQLNVYPNPNNGTFTLYYNLSSPNAELKINDVLGRTVYKQNIIGKEGKQTIDASILSNGIYFYQIRNDKETFQGKFVVDK
jgi:hypothetical protein